MKTLSFRLGFTLIEVALVLLVLTLLLGGLLVPLGTQFDNRNIAATQKQLDEIKEALVGYALKNSYLPCPDASGDGREDVKVPPAANPGTCEALEGQLPWADLGVGAEDAWGSRFTYRVSSAFSNHPISPPLPPFSLASNGDIDVCTASATGACTAGTLLTNDGVVVVLSRGKNRGLCGSPPLASSCGADEQENLDADDRFIMRTLSGGRSGSGEFDDMLVWLSPYTLFNRMVAAGRLPAP